MQGLDSQFVLVDVVVLLEDVVQVPHLDDYVDYDDDQDGDDDSGAPSRRCSSGATP